MKNYKYTILTILFSLCFQASFSQMIKTNATNSSGEFQLEKRMATTDDTVGIGEFFYYEISFLDVNAANTSLEISDVIPSGLEYVSYQALIGTFVKVSGAPPNNHNPVLSPVNVGPVTVSGQTITFSNLDEYSKGVFRIKVRFPDSACTGDIVTNNACAKYTNTITEQIENVCTTSGLTSTAEGIDPWAKVTKEPMYPAVFDAYGNWFININDPVVKYKITIEKDPAYANQDSGMLALDNIVIQDVLLSGGTITNISPSTGYAVSGTDVLINSSWSGNTSNFKKEFIIEVDYSGATTPLYAGQVITNTVNLIGQTCDDTTPVIKGTDEATVTVTDSLPSALPSAYLFKSVLMTNRVIGCRGIYSFMYKNTNNRPITNAIILDNIPDDIQPIPGSPITVTSLINSASVNADFDVEFNSNFIATAPTNSTFLPSTMPTSGNTLKISAIPGTVLYPNDYVHVQFSYILRSTPNTLANGVVTNCVNATGDIIDASTGITEQLIDNHCVSFTVENPAPQICVDKQVRKIEPGYIGPWSNSILDAKPGDELEFRIRLVNYGSSQFTGGTLTDVLDPKFVFQQFVNTPAGVTPNQSGANLDWSNINIGSSCSQAAYGGCSPNLPHIDVNFTVKVAPYSPPGQIINTATLNGNIPNALSDIAFVRVVNSFVIDITKEISNNGLVWTDYLVESANYTGPIFYRLKVENIGNMPVVNHEIYDELPYVGDIVFPTNIARGSNFSISNPNLISSPNYTASILSSAGRIRNCGDAVSGQLPASKTIKYISNNVLNPADVFIMQYSGTLPTSGVTSGQLAVNSAYFLDCSGSTNIITPSKLATLAIYDPPCYTCPESSQWEGSSVTNTIVNVPETGVHSELNGIPVYKEDYQLQTNWQWVTGVRIYISEFEPVYAEGCESCHFNMDQVGNLVDTMFPTQLGQLTKVATDYHGTNQDFVREIRYEGLPDISFRNGVSSNIAISLPDMVNPDCCVVSYNVCVKFVFEGPNCENCEVDYCFTAPEGPIFPMICPEPAVEIQELGKPTSDCCQKVLKPFITPCKVGAIYKWYGPQGFIVQQGTTTPSNDGRLIATENGEYKLEVQCVCPDASLTAPITVTHTVSGLLGNLPTTSGIVNHKLVRTSGGGIYSGNLNFSVSPALNQYGFTARVQQAFGRWGSTVGWSYIDTAIINKDVCAENGVDFNMNFTYNRPGMSENIIVNSGWDWHETWEDKYRIVIEWEGCNTSGGPIYFPITNMPPIGVIFQNPNSGIYQINPNFNRNRP